MPCPLLVLSFGKKGAFLKAAPSAFTILERGQSMASLLHIVTRRAPVITGEEHDLLKARPFGSDTALTINSKHNESYTQTMWIEVLVPKN